MKRREFITLAGGAAAVWPLVARAQQPVVPIIGFLTLGSPEGAASSLAALRKGLSVTGYDEGRNMAIEYHFASNELDRLAEWVADLVRRRVAVIVASGNAAAFAAKAATTTIPIVFSTGGDPVQTGLVASLNRPGGNVTGVTLISAELSAKRLGLLHELIPDPGSFAVMVNPTSPNTEAVTKDVRTAASAIGRPLEFVSASTNHDIDAAFEWLAQRRVKALLVASNTLFSNRRVQIVTLAAHHHLPAIYGNREDAEAGGLVSYGSSVTDAVRQAGIYVGRILKGEKPADLPVVQSTTFEFIINLRTAKTLGLAVPPTLRALANEVIE